MTPRRRAVGSGLAFDPSRDDEGVWLERRVKKQGLVHVAKARMLKMENGHLEFVFDDPVARGNYLISVYTRGGKAAARPRTTRRPVSAAR